MKMGTLVRGMKQVLPSRLGHWLALRIGVYLAVAVVTGLVFLVGASYPATVDCLTSAPILGVLIGLAGAAGVNLIVLRRLRGSLLVDPGIKVEWHVVEPKKCDIDEATATAIIALLLHAIAAGADRAAVSEMIRRLQRRE